MGVCFLCKKNMMVRKHSLKQLLVSMKKASWHGQCWVCMFQSILFDLVQQNWRNLSRARVDQTFLTDYIFARQKPYSKNKNIRAATFYRNETVILYMDLDVLYVDGWMFLFEIRY